MIDHQAKMLLGKKELLLTLLGGLLCGVFFLITTSLLKWHTVTSLAITVALCASWLTVILLFVYRNIQNEIRIEANRIEAAISLNTVLRPRLLLPPFGGSALEADTAHELVLLIMERRPKMIIECGSGLSTLIAAYALEKIGCGHIVSLDQSAQWAAITRQKLEEHDLSRYVSVVYAPLSPIVLPNKSTVMWYATESLNSYSNIDFLIIDGPTVWSGPEARYPALPFLWNKLANDAVIFVDDSNRVEERVMVTDWLALYSGQIQINSRNTGKGLAVLYVRKTRSESSLT
jgi:hypothetical protein